MAVKTTIKRNTYFDPVSLMTLTTRVNAIAGVEQAVVAMGTQMNKELLRKVDLLTAAANEAQNGDVMVVVRVPTEEVGEAAVREIEALLQGKASSDAARPGNIGIVSVSSTGAKEVAVRILDFGGGVTEIVCTGERDLDERGGGVVTIEGLRALGQDPATEVIVLVATPTAKIVLDKVLAAAAACGKPVVACLLGGSAEGVAKAGLHFGKTTKEVALKATILAGKNEAEINKRALNLPLIAEIRAMLKPEQRYIRALICDRTLCEEMMAIARETNDNVYSNIAEDAPHRLKNVDISLEHTFIAFSDHEITRGRPHPMIDPSLRVARLAQEARDPSVGVIVLDFMLGDGTHADPVGAMLPAIMEGKKTAAAEGRHLEILGYVFGTELDIPPVTEQTARLTAAGVTIASSCTNSGLLACSFVEKS